MSDQEQEHEDRAEAQTVEIGAKAFAALVGAGVGGPAGAVAAVALEPFLSDLLRRSWDEIATLRRRSAGQMLQQAADRSGVDPEVLISRAWRNEETTQLLADVLYETLQTFNVKKVRALARALANGLAEDDARPDHEQLIVAAIAAMDEAHVKVLTSLPGYQRHRNVSTTSVKSRTVTRRGMSVRNAAASAGLTMPAAEHLLATLVRIGAAAPDDSASDTRVDRLIIELQREIVDLNKRFTDLTAGKRVRAGSKHIAKPGTRPDVGYGRTPFGSECLAYMLDIDQDAAEEVGAELVDDEVEDGDGLTRANCRTRIG